MNATQRQEIESHERFLANFRARIDALPDVDSVPVSPDDDTLDADEDPTLPPPPHAQEHSR
jgi:hypothetical protein